MQSWTHLRPKTNGKLTRLLLKNNGMQCRCGSVSCMVAPSQRSRTEMPLNPENPIPVATKSMVAILDLEDLGIKISTMSNRDDMRLTAIPQIFVCRHSPANETNESYKQMNHCHIMWCWNHALPMLTFMWPPPMKLLSNMNLAPADPPLRTFCAEFAHCINNCRLCKVCRALLSWTWHVI